jgi:hypothetical protein
MDSGAGTHAYPSATSGNLLLLQTTGSSTWQYLVKSGFVFVTSSMGAGSTVTAAVLSSWLTNVRDGLNLANNNGFSSRVYSFSPAADNDIVASDHGNFGTTGWSNTVAYASHSAGGYNNWTLNATGLGNVSVTGNTKVGIRNTQYDVGAVTPDPVAGENTGFVAYFADQTGTGNDPKLVVTYTAPAPPSDPAIVSMSWGVTI